MADGSLKMTGGGKTTQNNINNLTDLSVYLYIKTISGCQYDKPDAIGTNYTHLTNSFFCPFFSKGNRFVVRDDYEYSWRRLNFSSKQSELDNSDTVPGQIFYSSSSEKNIVQLPSNYVTPTSYNESFINNEDEEDVSDQDDEQSSPNHVIQKDSASTLTNMLLNSFAQMTTQGNSKKQEKQYIEPQKMAAQTASLLLEQSLAQDGSDISSELLFDLHNHIINSESRNDLKKYFKNLNQKREMKRGLLYKLPKTNSLSDFFLSGVLSGYCTPLPMTNDQFYDYIHSGEYIGVDRDNKQVCTAYMPSFKNNPISSADQNTPYSFWSYGYHRDMEENVTRPVFIFRVCRVNHQEMLPYIHDEVCQIEDANVNDVLWYKIDFVARLGYLDYDFYALNGNISFEGTCPPAHMGRYVDPLTYSNYGKKSSSSTFNQNLEKIFLDYGYSFDAVQAETIIREKIGDSKRVSLDFLSDPDFFLSLAYLSPDQVITCLSEMVEVLYNPFVDPLPRHVMALCLAEARLRKINNKLSRCLVDGTKVSFEHNNEIYTKDINIAQELFKQHSNVYVESSISLINTTNEAVMAGGIPASFYNAWASNTYIPCNVSMVNFDTRAEQNLKVMLTALSFRIFLQYSSVSDNQLVHKRYEITRAVNARSTMLLSWDQIKVGNVVYYVDITPLTIKKNRYMLISSDLAGEFINRKNSYSRKKNFLSCVSTIPIGYITVDDSIISPNLSNDISISYNQADFSDKTLTTNIEDIFVNLVDREVYARPLSEIMTDFLNGKLGYLYAKQ